MIVKNKWWLLSVFLLFFSNLFVVIILFGGLTGSIYLSKYIFDEPIKEIIQKDYIKFTVYGYCINDDCKKKELSHNFDKLPSINELIPTNLLSGITNPVIPNLPTPVIPNLPTPAIPNLPTPEFPTKIPTPKSPFEESQTISNQLSSALNQLLSGFENFTPKSPTVNFSGFFSIPLIVVSVLNTLALILLFISRKILLNSIAIFFIFVSFILNLLSFIFTLLLFSFVFNFIDFIPGIGSYKTGNAIYLSGFSVTFLFIAFCILTIQNCHVIKQRTINERIK